MRKIMNNKEVRTKWMNGKIKRLIRETKIAYQIKKKNKFISRDIGNFCKVRKGKLGEKKDLCEIELANSIKDN